MRRSLIVIVGVLVTVGALTAMRWVPPTPVAGAGQDDPAALGRVATPGLGSPSPSSTDQRWVDPASPPAGSNAPSASAPVASSAAPSGSMESQHASDVPAPAEAPTASADPTQDASQPLPEVDWWTVLAALDSRRVAALADTDPDAVGEYAQAGSAAWRADRELIQTLIDGHLRPRGLQTRLIALEGVGWATARSEEASTATPAVGALDRTNGSDAVRLVVVDQRAAYTLVDDSGAVVQTVDAAGSRRWVMTLVRAGALPEDTADPGWRVVSVEAIE